MSGGEATLAAIMRAFAVLREATALLRAAGVDVAELAVETGRGA